MSLPELQHAFINAIFDPDQREAAAVWVKPHGTLDAAQRVGIYRNSVHGILWQYLQSLYPVCLQLVGDAFFEAACDPYIDRYPPTRPFLAEYGDRFADFLHQHPSLADMYWIADMARLEWARHQAWNAVNQPGAELPTSTRLVHSAYAIHQVWLAHQPEDHPDKLPLERIQIQQPAYIVVWRERRTLRQEVLDADLWHCLAAAQQLSPPETTPTT